VCSDGRGRDERGTGYKVYPAHAAAVNLAPTGDAHASWFQGSQIRPLFGLAKSRLGAFSQVPGRRVSRKMGGAPNPGMNVRLC
jgi:hypothetical protein